MDFKRQLRTSNVIIVFLCCSALLAGREAEETLPTPSGGSQNQPSQHENPPKQDTPTEGNKEEAIKSVPITDTRQHTQTENDSKTKDDSTKAVTPDDVTSTSPSSPPEGGASPTPPGGSDGKQHSPPHENQIKVESPEPHNDLPPGGVTEPATPSGGENVEQGNAKQDSALPSSESREPQTPKTEELPEGETKPAPADSPLPDTTQDSTTTKTSSDQAEHQEEVKTAEEVKEAVEGGEEKTAPPPATSDETPSHGAEEKMPSFDEWKEKMLAEQAQQAKQAKQEKLEAQAFQPVSGTVTKSKSKSGIRVNYASMSCGAKLIAANSEAKNSGFILTENKDQYMIQPCQAKKWFVVELCEPVAVQSIEIANLELFSSLPESFIVHTSERYPTKEWKTLGTFRARDERAVQSFPVVDEEMFAKYIKVEPLTHYGGEHYCPLTILRVFGTTAVEDYEDSEHVDTSTEEEDQSLHTPESPEEPSNLFSSATDTVLSLVKTVLSPGEKEKQDGVKLTAGIQMNGTSLNQSTVNATAPPPEGEQTAPCTPTVMTGEEGPPKQGQPLGTIHPQTPEASDQPPLVTLIESRPHASTVPFLLSHCNFCQNLDRPTCYSNRLHVCGYYRTLNFVMDTSCANTTVKRRHKEEKSGDKIVKSSGVQADGKPPPSEQHAGKTEQTVEPEGKKPERPGDQIHQERSNISDKKPAVAVKVDQGVTGTATTSQVSLEPSQGDFSEGKAKDSPVEVIVSRTPAMTENIKATATAQTTVPKTTEAIQTPKSAATASVSCDPSVSDCSTMGPDIVQIRPTTTEEASRTDTTEHPSEQVIDATKPSPTKTTDQIETTKVVGGQQSNGAMAENKTGVGPNGKDKVIYAETPTLQDNEYDLDAVPPPEDGEPIQKLSSGRRETAFMRLKNRIKALELNLNLSSRYLEELSQRYRRQMENMYLSLNKTIQKLTNTSRTAEQRDLRQQANITELTKRINYLTQQTKLLTDNLNNIHTQVIERHLFLMMIEGMVFLLIITWLLNRMQPPAGRVREPSPHVNKKSALSAPTTHTALRPTEQHTKPPDKPKKAVQKVHRRRNSIDATPPRQKVSSYVSKQRSKDDIGLRLSGSESGFGSDVLTTVAAASANSDFKEIVNRKKKKKKQNKGLMMSASSSTIASSTGSYSLQPSTSLRSGSSTRVHHNAGLIFSSRTSSQDGSPPQSASSSESGDSGTAPPSSSSSSILSSTGFRHNKPGARRSLDLREMQRASASGSNHGLSRKDHKRQRSDGSIATSNNRLVTNIGPTHPSSKVTNGKATPVQNGGTHQEQSSTWKGWFLGTYKK